MILELDPGYVDAYTHLVSIYFSQNLLEDAIRYSHLALEQLNQKQAKQGDSDTEIFTIKSSIYQNIGSCFYRQNKFENALEAYRKAYSINPRLLDVESRIREIQWIIDIRSLTKKLTGISLDTCNKQLVLHVGCGTYAPEKLHLAFRTPEWHEVRFDIDSDVKPDIIGTLTDMSAVESSSVAAIWSSHNIEHLYTHEVPIALKEFNRVLRFGGVVLVTCPDIQKVAEYVAKGKLENPLYSIGEEKDIPISALDILYGWGIPIASGNHFMAHRTGFTAETLRQKLLDAGFIDVVICREELNLWARAYKPS
jgi:tetratricopeptide (TPR) repeat protein